MSPLALRQHRIQVAGHRELALGRSRKRMMTGLLLFSGLVALLGLRLIDLTVLGERVNADPVDPYAAAIPPRADIIDRNGETLASTIDAYTFGVRPRDIVGNKPLLARQIAAAFPGISEARALAALNHDGSFKLLKRRVLPADAKRLNAIGEPGIVLEREAERLYPNIVLASHVLGSTNIDGKGNSGIELAFDERLSRIDAEAEDFDALTHRNCSLLDLTCSDRAAAFDGVNSLDRHEERFVDRSLWLGNERVECGE